MAKVLGLGGLFFRTRDPQALRTWYDRVLGVRIGDHGVAFAPADAIAVRGAQTVFSPFPAGTDYFAAPHQFMFNLIVDDLDAMLQRCEGEGVMPVRRFDDEPNGRFAHVLDLEGRTIELWQPRPPDDPRGS